MSYTTKRKIMNGTVYIVLGLVLTAVICVTVATVVGMRRKKQPVTDDDLPSAASVSPTKDQSIGQPTKVSSLTEEPSESKTPESKTGGDEPVIDPVKPVNYLPADGCLLKEYSGETPVYSLTMNDYRTHPGIDISAPVGSAVYAMSDGTVKEIYNDPMMGMCISIDHGDGLVSIYKNLSVIFPDGVSKGVAVRAGQTVGAVGDTCLIELADAEHLHFELTKNGKHLDPGEYLDLAGLQVVDSGED